MCHIVKIIIVTIKATSKKLFFDKIKFNIIDILSAIIIVILQFITTVNCIVYFAQIITCRKPAPLKTIIETLQMTTQRTVSIIFVKVLRCSLNGVVPPKKQTKNKRQKQTPKI
jgi:hypothetical protein